MCGMVDGERRKSRKHKKKKSRKKRSVSDKAVYALIHVSCVCCVCRAGMVFLMLAPVSIVCTVEPLYRGHN